MSTNEEWRSVKGFEGMYEVSNLGRIRSLDRYVPSSHGKKRFTKGRILKACDRGNGYPFVTMGKDGKQYNVHIHRAVAEAFVPNPNNYPVVNHIDRNPMNPRADNLEWCTIAYNNTYLGAKYEGAKKRWKKVAQIKDGKVIKIWDSLTQIMNQTNYRIGNISWCCNHTDKAWKAYGFDWRFI